MVSGLVLGLVLELVLELVLADSFTFHFLRQIKR